MFIVRLKDSKELIGFFDVDVDDLDIAIDEICDPSECEYAETEGLVFLFPNKGTPSINTGYYDPLDPEEGEFHDFDFSGMVFSDFNNDVQQQLINDIMGLPSDYNELTFTSVD